MSDKANTPNAGTGSPGSQTTPETPPSLVSELVQQLNSRDAIALKEMKGPAAAKPTPEPKPKADATATVEGADPDKDKKDPPEGDGASVENEDGTPKVEPEPAPKFDKAKLEPEALKAFDGMEKAIGRLTGKRKEAEEKLKDLQDELTEKAAALEASSKVERREPAADNPLSHLATAKEVEATVQQAESTVKWAKDHRKGAVLKGKDGSASSELDADAVAEIRDEAQAIIDKHGPDRVKFLEKREAAHKEAAKSYPDLLKGDAAKRREELLKEFPALKDHPRLNLLIGDLLEGEDVRKGRKVSFLKGAKKPAADEAAAAGGASKSSLSTDATPPNPRPTNKPDLAALKATAERTGRREDFETYMAAKLEA